jgi:predicted MFS family arabinose efflux permease
LLLLLAVVFADNFVGRQILAVMIEPIKSEFGVGDTAMGLISGLAFAAVYALMGLPAGRLVDRMPRTRLLAMACLLWAGATMACGLAGSFWRWPLRACWWPSANRRPPRPRCR